MSHSLNLTRNQIKVLQFLLIETYSTPSIIQDLLQQGTVQASYQLLNRMIKTKLICKAVIPVINGRGITIYGITEHGLALSDNSHFISRPSFQKSKVSLFTIQHKLDIQYFHVLLTQNEWSSWLDGSMFGRRDKAQKIPDAVAVSPTNIKQAFEIEREIKSLKRYKEIILSHLISRKNGSWDEIIYLCPTARMASSLKQKNLSIKSVNQSGKIIVLTESHFLLFHFFGYEEFTKKIKNIKSVSMKR